MENHTQHYENIRKYLLSIIDNKKELAIFVVSEPLKGCKGTRYSICYDVFGATDFKEYHYPSLKEGIINDIEQMDGSTIGLRKNSVIGIKSFNLSRDDESIEVNFNDEKETVEIIFKQFEPREKYELVKEDRIEYPVSFDIPSVTLYRIRALRDFSCPVKIRTGYGQFKEIKVKKGDLGGYVESERNLSHDAGCWIFDDAKVFHKARVQDNAHISNQAVVKKGAIIKDDSSVHDHSTVEGSAVLSGHSRAAGGSVISGDVKLNGNVYVSDYCQVTNGSVLDGDIYLEGSICVENAKLTGTIVLFGQYLITFDVHNNEEIVCYTTNRSITKFHEDIDILNLSESLAASTKKDIWSSTNFTGTSDELIEHVKMYRNDSVDYFRNLVEFH